MRRAIDFFEGDKVNDRALKNLVRAAIAFNQSKMKKAAPKKVGAKKAAAKPAKARKRKKA